MHEQLRDLLPEPLVDRFLARPDRSDELLQVLVDTKSRYHDPSGRSFTFWEKLVEVLEADAIADAFFDRPRLFRDRLYSIHKVAGYGQHNTWFALGVDRVAEAFARDPDLFVDLATLLEGDCIGGFPALTHPIVLNAILTRRDETFDAFGRLHREAGRAASAFLNLLSRSPVAEAWASAPDAYLRVAIRLGTIGRSDLAIVLRDAHVNDALVQCVRGELAEEALFAMVSGHE